MKKICSIILVLLFCVPVLAQEIEEVRNVIESKNKIEVDGYQCNYNLRYPLLETEGKTYISVRDMADIFNKDVEWNENDQTIYLESKEKEIKLNETITLKYAQAIVEDRFFSRVSSNTKYKFFAGAIRGKAADFYEVYIWFDGEENMEKEADCKILFTPSGECLSITVNE